MHSAVLLLWMRSCATVAAPGRHHEADHLTPDQKHAYTLLGKGGFGSVFAAKFFHSATQTEIALAVKVTSSLLQLDQKEQTTMYQSLEESVRREIKALSSLRHPNIIKLVGYCSTQQALASALRLGHFPRLYLVYELCEQGTLADWLRDDARASSLPWTERLHVAIGVASALEEMHRGGRQREVRSIFHRDVKAANIGLTSGHPPTAKVLDCGLAKYIPAHDSKTSVFSKTGQVFGTPGYQCPKYVARPTEYDAQSEIYSYGIVLAELFTGHLQNTPDLLDEELLEECQPDSRAGLWWSGAAEAMRALILECVAGRKNNRPQSMTDILSRLRDIAQGGVASPLSPGPQLRAPTAKAEIDGLARHLNVCVCGSCCV